MTDDAELERIVEGARSGEESAFALLVERVRSRVRAWATRYTADPDVADDIAQDVMIGLQRRVHQYRGESRFSTWLYTMTRRMALDYTRLRSRRDNLIEQCDIEHSAQPSLEQSLDEQTVSELILKYFDALPPRQRLVFERIDLRGESAADVARSLAVPAATVRAHLFKARRAIRARMLELHEPLVKEFLS